MGSTQPRSPSFHLVDLVHFHSHARDDVLPTFHRGRSVREPTAPALCLPPSHPTAASCQVSTSAPAPLTTAGFSAQSLQHFSSYCAASYLVQCWWYNVRQVLLQLLQFQLDKFGKMARSRLLSEYPHVYHCIQEVRQQREPLHFSRVVHLWHRSVHADVSGCSKLLPVESALRPIFVLLFWAILRCSNWKLK